MKVKGEWFYYYRAVDKFGEVIDYSLSPNRDEAAAKAFLNKAIGFCRKLFDERLKYQPISPVSLIGHV